MAIKVICCFDTVLLDIGLSLANNYVCVLEVCDRLHEYTKSKACHRIRTTLILECFWVFT